MVKEFLGVHNKGRERVMLVYPEHLSARTRACMGLIWCGVTGFRELAEFMLMAKPDVERFVEKLFASEHPLIRKAIMNGLPARVAVPIPNGRTIRCDGCGAIICKVPCIACAPQEEYEGPVMDPPDELPPDPACVEFQPTEAPPGSPEKIEVMRMRLERNEPIFHPDDRSLLSLYAQITDTVSVKRFEIGFEEELERCA